MHLALQHVFEFLRLSSGFLDLHFHHVVIQFCGVLVCHCGEHKTPS